MRGEPAHLRRLCVCLRAASVYLPGRRLCLPLEARREVDALGLGVNPCLGPRFSSRLSTRRERERERIHFRRAEYSAEVDDDRRFPLRVVCDP